MATNFPASLDTLTNPSATDTLDSPPHDEQHADANDAIEALQAKVGVDGSAVTTSHDYILTNGVLPTLNVDSGVLVVDDSNNRVGVNDASPSYALDVTGDINASGALRIGGVAQGEYIDYSGSITFTNFTLGNGTVNHAYYTRIGDFVHYVGQVTLGSTSAFTGAMSLSLPVNANTRERASGLAELVDSGVAAYRGAVHAGVTSTLLGFYAFNASATYTVAFSLSATLPFTWTTNDIFAWTVIYRAA